MRNAPSMRLERKKVTMALIRSNCGGSGVLRVVFPPLRLTTSAIQGTSVRMIPRKVCCIVHGASPDFCSSNEFSVCFICHYIIAYGYVPGSSLSEMRPLVLTIAIRTNDLAYVHARCCVYYPLPYHVPCRCQWFALCRAVPCLARCCVVHYYHACCCSGCRVLC